MAEIDELGGAARSPQPTESQRQIAERLAQMIPCGHVRWDGVSVAHGQYPGSLVVPELLITTAGQQIRIQMGKSIAESDAGKEQTRQMVAQANLILGAIAGKGAAKHGKLLNFEPAIGADGAMVFCGETDLKLCLNASVKDQSQQLPIPELAGRSAG